MSENKLMPAGAAVPANITNIKDNTENNFNINNSNVTFNVNLQQSASQSNDTEMMLAMSSFSHEYYQLLVTADEVGFKNGVITFPVENALSQDLVPPEILERCSPLHDAGIRELKTFPALICKENRDWNGKTSPDEIGFFGYIKNIQKDSSLIRVEFGAISAIRHSVLCDKQNATHFDLNMDVANTTLNRTAWSVHKTDLFGAFDTVGIDYSK